MHYKFCSLTIFTHSYDVAGLWILNIFVLLYQNFFVYLPQNYGAMISEY